MQIKLILDAKCILGEGPWWDAASQRLFWIDGFSDKMMIYDPATGENKEYPVGCKVGCAIPCENGDVLLTLQDGIYRLDLKTGCLEEVNDLERDIVNNRLNDGKCDSYGRLWFGSMSMTANQPEREFEVTGSFYKMENGKITQQFKDVGISNGVAWNKDETQMYYVDSPTGCVFAFDFDAKNGEISNRRVAVRISENEGIPDGMTIDTENKLWVAHFNGGRITRYDPITGCVLDTVFLPVSNVTCCCFGGSKLDTLYITTAREGLTPEQFLQEPLAGGLFAVKPGVKGCQLHKYKGL